MVDAQALPQRQVPGAHVVDGADHTAAGFFHGLDDPQEDFLCGRLVEGIVDWELPGPEYSADEEDLQVFEGAEHLIQLLIVTRDSHDVHLIEHQCAGSVALVHGVQQSLQQPTLHLAGVGSDHKLHEPPLQGGEARQGDVMLSQPLILHTRCVHTNLEGLEDRRVVPPVRSLARAEISRLKR